MGMEEISVVGLISLILDKYVVTTDDGSQYELSAILPWEAVPADYGMGQFAPSLGKRVQVTGMTDGGIIWGARIVQLNEGAPETRD